MAPRLAALLSAAAMVAANALAIAGAERSDLALDVPVAAEEHRSLALQLRLPRQVAAVDGRLYFDRTAGEVIGVAPVGGGTALPLVEIDGGVAFGAYGLAPSAGQVRLRVVIAPTTTGQLRFRVAIDAAADATGVRLAVGGQALGTLNVRGGSRLHRLPAAGPRFAPSRAAGTARDVVADGNIGKSDIDTVRAAWELSRLAGQPCASQVHAQSDANGDGCVDVADLQGLQASFAWPIDTPRRGPTGGGAQPIASLGGSLASDVAPAAAPNMTFVVDSTADTPDANAGDGVCGDSSGRCTLRAAITETNWSRGEDRIEFDIAGSAPVRIQLSGTPMPILHDRSGGVTIDGYTQPGSRLNTSTTGSNAIPGVELVGTANSPRGNAFRLTSAGNTIRGLVFNTFYRTIVFDGPDARNNLFIGNWVNYTASGAAAAYSANIGVQLNGGASENVFGTPALPDVNVIGRSNKAVFLHGPGTDANVFQNNFICMTPSGTTPTSCSTGIDHDFGPKHGLIGGSGANEGNVFGSTNLNGIEYSHGWNPNGADSGDTWHIDHNRAIGNWIGFRGDGSYHRDFRSGITGGGNGHNGNAVNVFDGSNYNLVEGNWMSAATDGVNIAIANSTGNVVRNNVIGESPLGQAAPIARWGVHVRENTRVHTVAGNTIRNAASGGVGLTYGNVRRITISRNLVSDTSGPAIFLATDGAGTANGGPAVPVITQATTVRASGTGIAGATVEVFRASRAAGQSGLPVEFLGSAVVGSNGSWSVPLIVAQGDRVVALNILPNGNTSTLGANVTASYEAPPPAPVADFSWSQQSGNLNVGFTDTSSGSPSQWLWDFGDGTGSTQQHPTNAYAQPGSYAVRLTASNAGGSTSRTRTIDVVAPVANLAAGDAFGRTTSGWGSADLGGAYTLQGNSANFSVGGGTGSIVVPRPGNTRSALLNGTSAQDVEITFRVRTDKPAAGANHFVYAVARRAGGNSEYRPRILLRPDGSVLAHASVLVNGSESPLAPPVVVSGLSHAANGWLWVKARVIGSGPTTIRVKAWADGQPEPTGWHFSATNTAAAVQSAGSLGLRVYIGGGVTNAPVRFDFDDYGVRVLAP